MPPAEKKPRVFLSYSWDDEQHQTWVRHFAERLALFGLDVRLDQWHTDYGDDLSQFMEQEVSNADFVVAVCTPRFAQKANDRTGGAGYEQQIITADVVSGRLKGRVIPVRRSGDLATALPTYLKGAKAIDLSDDVRLAEAAEDVARRVFNRPRYGPPTPMSIPELHTQTETPLPSAPQTPAPEPETPTQSRPAQPNAPGRPAAELTWTDPATGLMWAKADNGSDVTWEQAMVYAGNLQLGGYSDWRLPTIDELQGIYDPHIGGGRQRGNLQLSGWQWSSSQGNAPGEAWLFYFGHGARLSTHCGNSLLRRALCVRRSGNQGANRETKPAPAASASAPGGGEQAGELTWTDPETGLMWAKTDNGSDVNWQQATDYAQNLQLAGYSDWRLPTIDELQGIYDPEAEFHIKGGLQLSSWWQWSSSQERASGEAWTFAFGNGGRSLPRLGYSRGTRALCVRRSGD